MTGDGLCFNRALRRAAFERRSARLRAFAVAVAAQLVLLPALVALASIRSFAPQMRADRRCCRSHRSPAAVSSARAWRWPAAV
jgi:uncharacterized membrane protein YdfJ with MMPL/SSD domain